jgi:hypothetical protein
MNNIIGFDRNIFGNDGKCELLIHSDTFNGSTNFDDSSKNGAVITPYGSAYHSTSYSKIGGSSIKLPKKVGAIKSGLTITPVFSIYDDTPFCIDFWIRRDAVVTGNGNTMEFNFTINANEKIFCRDYARTPAFGDKDYYGMWVYGINQLSNPATLSSEVSSNFSNNVGIWRKITFYKHKGIYTVPDDYWINIDGHTGDHSSPEVGSDYLYLNGQPTTFYIENINVDTDIYFDEFRMSVGAQRMNFPAKYQSVLERAY